MCVYIRSIRSRTAAKGAALKGRTHNLTQRPAKAVPCAGSVADRLRCTVIGRCRQQTPWLDTVGPHRCHRPRRLLILKQKNGPAEILSAFPGRPAMHESRVGEWVHTVNRPESPVVGVLHMASGRHGGLPGGTVRACALPPAFRSDSRIPLLLNVQQEQQQEQQQTNKSQQ